ncbi:hypothetical protein Agub_g10352, partial [Astrephomene gubernaculifera]
MGCTNRSMRLLDLTTAFIIVGLAALLYVLRSLHAWWRLALCASAENGVLTAAQRSSSASAVASFHWLRKQGVVVSVSALAGQPDLSVATATQRQRRPLPPYQPYIKRSAIFAKIPGCHPEDIPPGYEQRLAHLIAVTKGNADNSSYGDNVSTKPIGHRWLSNVYIRDGCVELLLEEEEWGSGIGSDAEWQGSHLFQVAGGDVGAIHQAPDCALTVTEEAGVRSDGEGLDAASEAGNAAAAATCGMYGSGSGRWSDASSGLAFSCSSGSCSSSSGLDLATIIRALQLPEEQREGDASRHPWDSCTDVGVAEGEGESGAGRAGRLLHSSSVTAHAEEAAAGSVKAGEGAPGTSTPDRHDLPQAAAGPSPCPPALEVLALHPRVVLLPPPPPPAAGSLERRQQQRLLAVVSCPTLQAAAGPQASGGGSSSSLEVLLRCQGRYLPLQYSWGPQLVAGAAAAEPGTSGREAGAGLGEEAEAGEVPPGWSVKPLPDVRTVRSDVNLPQLLRVEPRELPSRPGIALVDFRWCGRPCRAVPLVFVREAGVVSELGGAVPCWPRSPAELDELLLDLGTWEFHAAEAGERQSEAAGVPAASGGGGGSAALDAVSAARLAALGAHLLRYVTACGWERTAAHIARQLAGVSEAAAAGAAAVGASSDGGCGVAEGAVGAAANAGPQPGCAPRSGSPGGDRTGVLRRRGQKTGSSTDTGTGGEASALPGDRSGAPAQSHRRLRRAASLRLAWRLLLLALGLRRDPPEEAEAFRAFEGPWIFAHGQFLIYMEFMCLLALLFRARHDILAPSNLTSLASCIGGSGTLLAWPFLPYPAWVRLVNGYRYPRFLCYAVTKGLIAFCGFPPPPGIVPYLTGPGLLVMEGVIVPGASMLTPAAAAL